MLVWIEIKHLYSERKKASARVDAETGQVVEFFTERKKRNGKWIKKSHDGALFEEEMERLGFEAAEARFQIEEALPDEETP